MCETKLCCLCEEDQEDWKTGLVIPESFLARTPKDLKTRSVVRNYCTLTWT